jgi:ureidoglycolate hydrolase
MKLVAEELTTEGFRTFGRLIGRPARSEDASGPGWMWWAETVLLDHDDRPFGVGYLDLVPGPATFDWAERHMRTVEVILPLDGDCLIYVGPNEYPREPGRIPSMERFRAFRIRAGQGVAMEPGVWHGAPFAIDRPISAVVLILQRTGSDDTTLVRFPEDPVGIEMGTGG